MFWSVITIFTHFVPVPFILAFLGSQVVADMYLGVEWGAREPGHSELVFFTLFSLRQCYFMYIAGMVSVLYVTLKEGYQIKWYKRWLYTLGAWAGLTLLLCNYMVVTVVTYICAMPVIFFDVMSQ